MRLKSKTYIKREPCVLGVPCQITRKRPGLSNLGQAVIVTGAQRKILDVECSATYEAKIKAFEIIRAQVGGPLDGTLIIHILHFCVDEVSRITTRLQAEIWRQVHDGQYGHLYVTQVEPVLTAALYKIVVIGFRALQAVQYFGLNGKAFSDRQLGIHARIEAGLHMICRNVGTIKRSKIITTFDTELCLRSIFRNSLLFLRTYRHTSG